MGHTADQVTDFLRYARNASPKGLRAAVYPVVRRVLPAQLRARVRGDRDWNIAVADRWIDNHYTISDYGVKRHFFFVCGCFKSGTNWVQNLLNLHPQALVDGEFHFEILRNAVEHLTNVYWFIGSRPDLRDAALDASEIMMRRMIYAGTRSRPGAVWLGDRTPNPLRTIIRGAPQIMITRDVRDVLVSWSFHHLRLDDERGMAVQFRDAWRSAAAAFREDPDAFNPLDGLLGNEEWVRHHARHWAEVVRQSRLALPGLTEEGARVLDLRYEQMHADLPGQVNRIYEFLGLDPTLAEPPSRETKTLPGFRKENRQSFFRKGTVGEWRSHLDEKLCSIIKEEAGEEMIAAGYEKDLNW